MCLCVRHWRERFCSELTDQTTIIFSFKSFPKRIIDTDTTHHALRAQTQRQRWPLHINRPQTFAHMHSAHGQSTVSVTFNLFITHWSGDFDCLSKSNHIKSIMENGRRWIFEQNVRKKRIYELNSRNRTKRTTLSFSSLFDVYVCAIHISLSATHNRIISMWVFRKRMRCMSSSNIESNECSAHIHCSESSIQFAACICRAAIYILCYVI